MRERGRETAEERDKRRKKWGPKNKKRKNKIIFYVMFRGSLGLMVEI